jgi:hypothetical protein
MSDEYELPPEVHNEVTNRKISVTFERSVGYEGFGNVSKARAWVEGEVATTANVSDVALAMGDLFMAAKAAVLDELGIEYMVDDQGVLREKNTSIVSTDAATSRVEAAFGNAQSDDGESTGYSVRVMNPKDAAGPLPGWLLLDCQQDGTTAVWDNRKTRTGNQPWFTEAVPKGATGKGKDGRGKPYWPPK